jgi:uncharacterized protein YqjF (DUF2071 family)
VSRPLPVPVTHPVMLHRWSTLTFLHWRYDPAVVQRLLPSSLEVETFEGTAWVGLVPFAMRNVRAPGVPALPWVSNFPETNVRTYVRGANGETGIWFFSLDAARAAAAAAARLTYRLPYRHARMAITRSGPRIEYVSRAVRADAVLRVSYEPAGPVSHPVDGTLEHFLTERYCLYTVDRGRIRRADIHHPPWPLQPARGEVAENTMTRPLGLSLPDRQPLLHYAARQDVLIWPPSATPRPPEDH